MVSVVAWQSSKIAMEGIHSQELEPICQVALTTWNTPISRQKTLKKALPVLKSLPAIEEGQKETLIHLMTESGLSPFLFLRLKKSTNKVSQD